MPLTSVTMRKSLLVAGVTLALASLAAVSSAGYIPCPQGNCGNSPVVDGAAIEGQAFHELSVAGEANAAGFVVTGIRKPGTRPAVENQSPEEPAE